MSSYFDGMAAIFRDTLGEDDLVPYTHDGTTVHIRPIFDTPAILVDAGADVQMVDCDAWAHFAAEDLTAGYDEGDTVVIRGATYRTKAPMADGQGMVRFPLMKVS